MQFDPCTHRIVCIVFLCPKKSCRETVAYSVKRKKRKKEEEEETIGEGWGWGETFDPAEPRVLPIVLFVDKFVIFVLN